jgi:hypothetical protein
MITGENGYEPLMMEDTPVHEIRELARRLQALLDELAARHERLRLQRDTQPYSTAEVAAEATATFQWWKAEYRKIAAESEALGVSLADLMRVRA